MYLASSFLSTVLVSLCILLEVNSAPQDIIEQIQNGTNIIPGMGSGVDPIQAIQNQTNININPGDYYEQFRNQTGGVTPPNFEMPSGNPGDYYEQFRNQTGGVTPPNFEMPSGNPGDYYEQIRNQTGGITPEFPPNVGLPSGSDIQIQNCIPTNIMGETTTTTTTTTETPAEKKHGKSRRQRHRN